MCIVDVYQTLHTQYTNITHACYIRILVANIIALTCVDSTHSHVVKSHGNWHFNGHLHAYFALNSKNVSLESWHVSLLVWSEIDLDQYRFLHIMASATTNSYTRNSCDSEPAWNWNAYAHCCLLKDSVTLWHMIHMHIQHVCLVLRWSVLLTLHILVQLNPHPHSMRLRLRIFVWPGLAWLLNLMYTFVYEKSVAIFKEQSISFFNCCRITIYFCSFKVIQVFILPKLPDVTLSTMSSLDWFGPGGARHKLHKGFKGSTVGQRATRGPTGVLGLVPFAFWSLVWI